MKNAINNNSSYKDINNVVKSVLKNAKWPEKKEDFNTKIHEKLKKFMKKYTETLKKMLQLEWAQEAIEFRIEDINLTQVKAYDSLEFSSKFPEDFKWFLQDVNGKEEADEVEKLVKKHQPEKKPTTAKQVEDMSKKLKKELEKYFDDELLETKKDFMRERIESYLKSTDFTTFIKLFDEKSSFKTKWVTAMKTKTLNEVLGEALKDDDFDKMIEKVDYPEKDTFKGQIDQIKKNLDKVFGEKKRLRRLSGRKLGKSDDMKDEEQSSDQDTDDTSEKNIKVLKKEDLEKKIEKKIDNVT